MLSFQHDNKSECPEMLKHFRQRAKGIREKTLELGDVCDLSRGLYNRIIGWLVPCPYQIKLSCLLSMVNERLRISFHIISQGFCHPRQRGKRSLARPILCTNETIHRSALLVVSISSLSGALKAVALSHRFPQDHCLMRSVTYKVLPPMEPAISLGTSSYLGGT